MVLIGRRVPRTEQVGHVSPGSRANLHRRPEPQSDHSSGRAPTSGHTIEFMADGQDFQRVVAIDAVALRDAVARAGGPTLELIERLAGGAVGAWLVGWPDGHLGVLTWAPPVPAGQPPGQLDDVMRLMDLAWEAGIPLPRYEAVFDVGDLGAAVIQERAFGQTPTAVSPNLVESLIDLVERRRGILAGTSFSGRPMPVYLASSGPGWCLHESLRSYSTHTAALLQEIEALAGTVDHVVGDDLVHLDYHLGNILVDPDQPGTVTAILDWDGARAGTVAIDLAILAFDLTRRAPRPLQRRVESQLLATTPADLVPRIWAHAGLRLVDWAIRHHGPDDVDHWVRVTLEHLRQ